MGVETDGGEEASTWTLAVWWNIQQSSEKTAFSVKDWTHTPAGLLSACCLLAESEGHWVVVCLIALASSLCWVGVWGRALSASLPTSFRDSTRCHRGYSSALMPRFLRSYISIILANRNSFKGLASRWALPLFQGLMHFLLYLYIPLVILGTYKERSICLCSQCHIA